MEAVNQTLPTSSDETETSTVSYSPAVHKVLVIANAGMLGILQLTNQQSSVSETHKPLLLCFCVFGFLYAVLRIREDIEVRRRPGFVAQLVGHTSHLFGGLATIVVSYMVSVPFAMVLLFFWGLWLSVIAYRTVSELIMVYWAASITGAGSDQLSPVLDLVVM